MTDERISELESLVELARDKSRDSRSALVAAINDLYSGENHVLTEQDQALMVGIMRDLIHDVEMSVRRILSERLSDQSDAPSELVVVLANEDIEVARPILEKSEVLRDEELIEIIQYRAMEHQVAIARRKVVSEPVSDALVATNNENVVEALLCNRGAKFSAGTMADLVEQSRTISKYQRPLVQRQDLSPELAKRLYWGVSAALRKYIAENFEIDPSDLDDTLESAVVNVIGRNSEAPTRREKGGDSEATDEPDGAAGLIKLIRDGDIDSFMDKFRKLSGLRLELARRILFEPNGEGLAIACKAIGLDNSAFTSIFMFFRSGRLGDKHVESDEVSNAVSFYDRLDGTSAEAMLQRWRRDPRYLNALRLTEQI